MRIRLFAGAAIVLMGCVSIKPAPPLPDVRAYFSDEQVVDQYPVKRASCGTITVPRVARDTGTQGWVVLGLDVEKDGSVSAVAIHAASDPMFEKDARRCALATTYYPAEADGQPVAFANTPQIIHFMLDEPSGLFGLGF